MIIRCLTATADSLPGNSYDSNQGVNPDTVFPVTPGRAYPVYAITIFLGIAWYYVPDDDGLDWPTWVPASLFEVIDGHMPASWTVGHFRFASDQYPLISFPEWASDHRFYERLVDGDPDAVRTYALRRAEVDEALK